MSVKVVEVSLFGMLCGDAAERGARYIRDYYAFLGPRVDGLARSLPSTPDAVKAAFEALVAVGADEVIAWPTSAELDQVEFLADVVAKSALG